MVDKIGDLSQLRQSIRLLYARLLSKLGVEQHKAWFDYLGGLVYDQLVAVVPISLFLILFRAIVFQEPLAGFGGIFAGLLAVILGLLLFVEGLKYGLMPLGEMCGNILPKKVHLSIVLAVAFVLGVSVTFAEPAIGALGTLGSLVSRQQAPYLNYLLNEWSLLTMLFVGIGVGVAAILGIVRLLYKISLKTLIYFSLIPTILLSCYAMWIGDGLSSVLGLAWDCGAVTTGPVTVPIVLALGLGVTASKAGEESSPLSGFGIVTLASVFPIMSVIILSIILSLAMSKEDIMNTPEATSSDSWYDASPYREAILAIRAIVPLVIFLIIVIKLIVRENLPYIDLAKAIIKESDAPPPVVEIRSDEIELLNKENEDDEDAQDKDDDEEAGRFSKDGNTEGTISTLDTVPQQEAPRKKKITDYGLWVGIACALFGMIVFNIGLSFGLAPLGQASGGILPASFTTVDDVAHSPRFSYGVGLLIVTIFSWVLGFLATIAEPALAVMGMTVEKLTEGALTKKMLIFSVSFGVGTGIALGVLKIIFQIPLIYFIFVGYVIAVGLTIFSSEDIVNVAWDSAGVTTGPVTVPFVLTVGVSLGNVLKVSEGFGILTLASAGPIISVLLTGFITAAIAKNKSGQQQVQSEKN